MNKFILGILMLGLTANICWGSSVCAISEPECTAACIPVPGTPNCGVANCCDNGTSFKCSCQETDSYGYCSRCGW